MHCMMNSGRIMGVAREVGIAHLLMPSIRDTSIMLKLIMVLLYMITEWLLWMKPMPAKCHQPQAQRVAGGP